MRVKILVQPDGVSARLETVGADFDNPAAMLAMDRVAVVFAQPAVRAFVFDVVGPEDGLEQAQEQGDADDHDRDGKDSAHVAGRSQR